MIKKLLSGVVVALIVLAGLSIVSIFVLDGIAQSVIQTGGSEGLGVDIKLDSAHVGFFTKKTSVKGIKIKNPESFQSEETPYLLTIEDVRITFNIFQMFEKKVIIPSVTATGVVLDLQQYNNAKSNIEVVINHISQDETPDSAHHEPPFIIETLTISNVKVIARGQFTVLGSKPITAPIKTDIVLHGVGGDGDAEVAIETITTAITQAIMKELMDNPVDGISKVVLSSAIKTVDNIVKEILGVAGGIVDFLTGKKGENKN
jgi:hypothetical protein